jgi:D-alanyl-D-alanine carboxypeptidase
MKYLFTDGHPEFEPGSQYGYRNSNFNVLGLVIEVVTDSLYHSVLKERIYNKIDLKDTYLLDHDIFPDDERIAHGYTQDFDGTLYHGSQPWAAGGMVSSVSDLSIFVNALVRGELFRETSTFSLMVTPANGSSYGLGIFIRDDQEGISYGHGGGIFGYNLRLEYFPQFETTIISAMSFNGFDFIVTNWYDDICYPAIRHIRYVQND